MSFRSLVFPYALLVAMATFGQTTQIMQGYSWRAYTGTTAPVCLGPEGTGALCHYYPTNSFESAYDEFAAFRTPDGNPNNATAFMNFRVAFPLNYNPSRPEPYPVILMLHGAGESGRIWSGNFNYAPSNVLYDNNSRNLLHGGNVHQQAANRNPTHPQAFPGIIIFPQVSYSGSWASGWQEEPTTNQEFVYEFLEHMVANYNADINRIYVHGLSNGGRGTWDTATKRPDLFAAVLPMSGLPYNSDISAERLVTTPIRLYQGGTDTNPSPGGAMNIINKLVANGGNPEYILYPNEGHGIWNNAYNSPDFWSWMLDKDKRKIYSYGDRRHLNNGETLGLCSGASRKIGFSRGYSSYQWKKGGVNIPGATSPDLTIVGTGDYQGAYSVAFTRPNGTTGESFTIHITGQGTLSVPELTVKGSLVMPYTRDNGDDIGSIGSTETRLFAPAGYSQYRWYRNDVLQAQNSTSNVKITHGGGSGSGGSNFNGQGNQANAGDWTVTVLESSGCWSNHSNPLTLVYNTSGHTLPTGPSVNQDGSTSSPLHYIGTIGLPQLQALSATSMLVTWTETVPDEEFFEIWRQDGTSGGTWNMVGIVPAKSTQFIDTGLNPNTGYAYTIRAMVSTSGRFSRKSATNTNSFTSTLPDTEAPTPPSALTLVSATSNSITISWAPSTDNHAVQAYELFNGTTLVATLSGSPPATTYTFENLVQGSTYLLNVRAVDFSNNRSNFPQALIASTQSLVNGVAYNYFKFNASTFGALPSPKLTNFDWGRPVTSTGFVSNVDNVVQSIDNGDYYFIDFNAYIYIHTAGVYRFYTDSDDGAKLFIDGNLIIDADFDQGTGVIETGVTPTALSVGLHSIRVQFYENTGNNVLRVRYNLGTTNNYNSASVIPNSDLYRVGTPSLTNYYPRTTMGNNLTTASNWTTNQSGTGGSSPAHFGINNAVFNISGDRTLSNAWTVSGTNSYVKVLDGATLTLNNTLTGRLSAGAGATINLNTTSAPEFYQLDPTSTVNMNVAGTVPQAVYGNLNLGSGNKTLPVSSTYVMGDLQVDNNVTLTGSTAPNRSTLTVAGNVTFQGSPGVSPSENQRYSLILEGPTPHTISVNNGNIALAALEAEGIVNFNFNDSNPHTITVGLPNGPGGLTLRSGSVLNLGQHNLVVNGVTGINATGDTGELSVNGGNITVNTTSQLTSSLYFSSDNHTVNNLSLTNIGSGEINLAGPTKLTNLMTVGTGTTVNMYGDFLVRSVSDNANGTGRIGPLTNGARITGNISFERYMSGEGRIYRYISSPVKDATAAQLQQSFPITGNFDGADVISGVTSGASMFHYHEPTTGGYVPFPSANNQETMQTGKGYAAFIREGVNSTTWNVTGEPHQGTIPFTLTGVTGDPEVDDGWNLLGNPYPAPIKWNSGGGWTRTGVNGTAYIRENSNGTTQVLSHDGTVGTNDWDGVIAPGQAFWVRTTSANPSLSVNENAKQTTDGAFYREGQPVNVLEVIMRSASQEDGTIIRFVDGATAAFDTEIDGSKLDNTFFNLSTLTSDNKPMAINLTTPDYCVQEIKLRTANAAAGTYTLEINGLESLLSRDKVTLIDNFLNTETVITDSETLSFSITADPASKADGRFVLRFEKPEVRKDMILSSTAACEQNSPVIRITNAQPGVEYQAFIGGTPVSTGLVAQDHVLDLPVQASALAYGATTVSMKAGFRGCNSFDLAQTVAVQRDTLEMPVVVQEHNQLVANIDNALYTWYKDSVAVEGLTSRLIEPAENGTYFVSVTKGTCTKVSEPVVFVITSTEGSLHDSKLYPNPTRSKVIVTLSQPIVLSSVKTYSALGVEVPASVTMITDRSAEVDLGGLPAGMFMVRVNGRLFKVIKE